MCLEFTIEYDSVANIILSKIDYCIWNIKCVGYKIIVKLMHGIFVNFELTINIFEEN